MDDKDDAGILRNEAESLEDDMYLQENREAEANDDAERQRQRDYATEARIEQLRTEAETYSRSDSIGRMWADHKLAEASRLERRLQMVREDRELRD